MQVEWQPTVVGYVNAFFICPRHTKLSGQALCDRLLEECKTRTNTDQELIKALPQHTVSVDDEGKVIPPKLIDGTVDYSFDEDGNLSVISKVSLNTKQQNSVKSALQIKFNTKVQLV